MGCTLVHYKALYCLTEVNESSIKCIVNRRKDFGSSVRSGTQWFGCFGYEGQFLATVWTLVPVMRDGAWRWHVSKRLMIGRLKGDYLVSRVEVVQLNVSREREHFQLWQPTADWLKVSVWGCDWMKRENELIERWDSEFLEECARRQYSWLNFTIAL